VGGEREKEGQERARVRDNMVMKVPGINGVLTIRSPQRGRLFANARARIRHVQGTDFALGQSWG